MRALRWIHAQSLSDLRVISTGIARKLGAIPEQIRRKSPNESGRNCARFFRFENQIDTVLFCFSLGLHTLALPKIGCASEIKTENIVFVLYFARLALSLQQVLQKEIDNEEIHMHSRI